VICFLNSKAPIPYWAEYEENNAIRKAIVNYWLNKELTQELSENSANIKKIKI
jgi:hypothetical protein